MLDSYSMQRGVAVGRLSAGFGGAFFMYGGLIASVFLLQNSEKILAAASEPARMVMIIPSVPPPAAPAPALGKAQANTAAPVSKTEAPKPIKPEIAPKVVPPNEPAEVERPTQPTSATPTNNNFADELANLGTPDGDPFSKNLCGGDTGIPCGKDPKGDPKGDPNADPNNSGPLLDDGGAVPLKAGMEPPKKIAAQCALPAYPEQAKAAGLTGSVKLRITVSRAGKVEQMSVLEGPEIFQSAAKSYLENCAFTPAIFNGHAISVTKLEVVNFTLR